MIKLMLLEIIILFSMILANVWIIYKTRKHLIEQGKIQIVINKNLTKSIRLIVNDLYGKNTDKQKDEKNV